MQNHTPPRGPLSSICGLVFQGLVRLRNRMYDLSLLPQVRLSHPVISIGNLTVGGSGKTPFVIHVARTISRMGAVPALLSRGYGREGKAPIILAPGARIPSPARTLGDEPALVRRHESRLWLGIWSKRYIAGLQISRHAERVCFLLDDGFQHRHLRRDLDLVVIDRTQPLEENRMLPAGTMREPAAGLRRADVVVINGQYQGHGEDPIELFVHRIDPSLTVFHCQQRIDRFVRFSAWQNQDPESGSRGHPPSAYLVAAIGNPDRFRKDVEALGIAIAGTRFFGDHFRLRDSDWADCIREACARGAASVITTEKDAIKLTEDPGQELLVAVQSTHLEEQDEFERKLDAIFRRYW
ncbi:MAG: tetraacyldisaccharide 4'-kinase [Acidobacteriota bacterium]